MSEQAAPTLLLLAVLRRSKDPTSYPGSAHLIPRLQDPIQFFQARRSKEPEEERSLGTRLVLYPPSPQGFLHLRHLISVNGLLIFPGPLVLEGIIYTWFTFRARLLKSGLNLTKDQYAKV